MSPIAPWKTALGSVRTLDGQLEYTGTNSLLISFVVCLATGESDVLEDLSSQLRECCRNKTK